VTLQCHPERSVGVGDQVSACIPRAF